MKWKLEKIINSHIQNLEEYQEISKYLSTHDMDILIHIHNIYLRTFKINMSYNVIFDYFYIFVPEYHNYLKCWYHKFENSIVFEIWKAKPKPRSGMVRIGILHYEMEIRKNN